MPTLYLSRMLQRLRSPENIAVLKARAQTILAREYGPGAVQSAWLDLTEEGTAILVVSSPEHANDPCPMERWWGLDRAPKEGE